MRVTLRIFALFLAAAPSCTRLPILRDCFTPLGRISPAAVTLAPGDTTTLRVADISYQCAADSAAVRIRFQSSDTAVATVDSISGLVRASAPGTTTVSVPMTTLGPPVTPGAVVVQP